MSLGQPLNIESDSDTELSSLTELTPTNPGGESPEIAALLDAADDAAYDLAYSQLPSELRLKVSGVQYVRFESLRGPKSKKRAYYWKKDNAEELLRVTKGSALLMGIFIY
jgi:hypothetical protein